MSKSNGFDTSTASQTLDSKQLETLYYEGVVRYPSVRTTGSNVTVREMGLQTEPQVEVLHSPPAMPADTGHTSTNTGLKWDEDSPLVRN